MLWKPLLYEMYIMEHHIQYFVEGIERVHVIFRQKVTKILDIT